MAQAIRNPIIPEGFSPLASLSHPKRYYSADFVAQAIRNEDFVSQAIRNIIILEEFAPRAIATNIILDEFALRDTKKTL